MPNPIVLTEAERNIYCCGCEQVVSAALVSGRDVYPHRADLSSLPFWQCPTCKNFVGCHHKTKDRTRPLGVIATQAIKDLRKQIHVVIDPIWQDGIMDRGALYKELGAAIGRKYHTAELRNEAECKLVLVAAKSVKRIALARAGTEGKV